MPLLYLLLVMIQVLSICFVLYRVHKMVLKPITLITDLIQSQDLDENKIQRF